MDKVADCLLTLRGEKTGFAELGGAKLVGRAFCLRYADLGEFEARVGISDCGKEITACLRRMPPIRQKNKLFLHLRGA